MPWREVGSETRGRHLETGTEANTMKNIVYWIFFSSMACSSCFLIPPWTTWPEHYLPPWAGPSYINHWIQKINPQSCLQRNVMEAIPQLNFVFPDCSSLCQVNKNLTNTMPMMLTLKGRSQRPAWATQKNFSLKGKSPLHYRETGRMPTLIWGNHSLTLKTVAR